MNETNSPNDENKRNLRHGYSPSRRRHPLYIVWFNIKQRCTNRKHPQWEYYGGRGIKMCAHWATFANFLKDVFPTWIPGLTIDRWPNNNGDYEPGNFRWATRKEQQNNRRQYLKRNS